MAVSATAETVTALALPGGPLSRASEIADAVVIFVNEFSTTGATTLALTVLALTAAHQVTYAIIVFVNKIRAMAAEALAHPLALAITTSAGAQQITHPVAICVDEVGPSNHRHIIIHRLLGDGHRHTRYQDD
jgi:hypothetical protein